MPTFKAVNGGCKTWHQYNDDHSFKIVFADDQQTYCDNLSLGYDGMTYNLIQIHLHSLSEHTFGGGFASAEAHLVHKNNATGKLIVLGIMLDVTGGSKLIPRSNNTFLDNLWTAGRRNLFNLNINTIKKARAMDPYHSLLPPNPTHYRVDNTPMYRECGMVCV